MMRQTNLGKTAPITNLDCARWNFETWVDVGMVTETADISSETQGSADSNYKGLTMVRLSAKRTRGRFSLTARM